MHPLPGQKVDQEWCESLSSGHEIATALMNQQQLSLPVQDQASQYSSMDGAQFLLKLVLY